MPAEIETNGDIHQDVLQKEVQLEEPIVATVKNGAAAGPKKMQMSTSVDTASVRAAYEDVRSDSTDTQWAVFKFDGARITCVDTGSDFDKFKEHFSENERAFGYMRIQTGDEMSKRQKFIFITWIGPSVNILQRAKMSTDKAVMKNIVSNFAAELQLDQISEIDLKYFIEELNKAGGANYGTGVREN
ncbi:unnamed protein product [Acanthoscelides obtectus]|uniref:Coactosin-like protein n=2 Tax=Acanthoscelides obtectus TaxID=200917 RepID=A0A9P0Q2K4_ACAOB|nr:unnamed protein product [Acanthoscelides obtectus]CAK1664867.1 Coactosin-like protein [Acanthoscelides obtectus]